MITEEQRQARKSGIFSSDVPRIMNGGGVRLCLEKMGVIDEEEYDSREMRIGTKCENLILDAYEHVQGVQLQQRSPDTLRHFEKTWLGAHLDAIENPKVNVEAKSVGFWMRKEWGEGGDECPSRVIWQTQEQMVVTGAKVTHVPVCFINEDSLKSLFLEEIPPIVIYTIPADDYLQEKLVDSAQRLWNCIVNKTMPDPEVPSDVDLLYRKDNGGAIEATEEIFNVYLELEKAREAKSTAEEIEKALKLTLKNYMLDSAVLQYENRVLNTWKKSKDGVSFDKAAFELAHPDLYRQFLKPKEGSRPFLTKELK